MIIFTFEENVLQQLKQTMNLKFFAAESYWDIIINNEQAFQLPLKTVSNQHLIQYNFPSMGLYALEIELKTTQAHPDTLESSENNRQRFLFLVGFPLIKILLFIALGFLCLLIFIVLRQLKSGATQIKG